MLNRKEINFYNVGLGIPNTRLMRGKKQKEIGFLGCWCV
jgi:hypothetical protein